MLSILCNKEDNAVSGIQFWQAFADRNEAGVLTRKTFDPIRIGALDDIRDHANEIMAAAEDIDLHWAGADVQEATATDRCTGSPSGSNI